MEKRCMIIDEDGNVVSIGIPDCIEKRREYWESRSYRLELADKDEAIRRYQEYLKKVPIDISE
ncbi:MAG TPA: hypothetical protein VMV04_09735 [Thermodesulfobacteriota bacterium]|nr:hypothetical protein [Thermodesulfobacteriota bacterium]